MSPFRRLATSSPRMPNCWCSRCPEETSGPDMGARAALIALCAILLAGASAPARSAEAYRPDPKLVEAARKEGQVVFYTTLIVEQIVRPLIKAFHAQIDG